MVFSPVIAYSADHFFQISPEELWSTISQAEMFEQWWPWLGEFHLEGPGLTTGTVLHGVITPPLPYRMRVEVELIDCLPCRKISAVVSGDLKGEALVLLAPKSQGTSVKVSWTVEMMQGPMRLASRFAHPVMQWGHDRVVDMTVAGPDLLSS